MIRRNLYINRIKDYIDNPMIKIIKGIRRCGKTELLKLIVEEIKEKGIDERQIVYINFESLSSIKYTDFISLYEHILEIYSNVNEKLYIFLDEIQEVEFWEKAVRSIRIDIPCDIYLTGSNAQLLSGDLASLLSGRYIEFEIYPLSYSEFKVFYKNLLDDESEDRLFNIFVRQGGFPDLINMVQSEKVVYNYLSSIYDTVVLRDIIERYSIRYPEQLKRIMHYIMDNIGQMTSGSKILDYLNGANKEKLSTTSLYTYIEALEHAMIIYSVKPFNLKGKRILKRSEKFYLSDLGLRHALMGYRENDIGQLLENIVFLELRRREYAVYIGKIDDYEVDFVAVKGDIVKYYQVSYSIINHETYDREFRSLEMISDNFEKTVISMDNLEMSGRNGIKWKNIIEFLNEPY